MSVEFFSMRARYVCTNDSAMELVALFSNSNGIRTSIRVSSFSNLADVEIGTMLSRGFIKKRNQKYVRILLFLFKVKIPMSARSLFLVHKHGYLNFYHDIHTYIYFTLKTFNISIQYFVANHVKFILVTYFRLAPCSVT